MARVFRFDDVEEKLEQSNLPDSQIFHAQFLLILYHRRMRKFHYWQIEGIYGIYIEKLNILTLYSKANRVKIN